MLINLTYNPSKNRQEKFLDELSYNLDYSFRQCNTVHALVDINFNFLHESVKKIESIITPFGLEFFDVHDPTRLA